MAIHFDTQGPAPDGFHVPLSSEWSALCGILTSTFGMAGNATTMGTYLKMPMAGYRSYSNASTSGAGSTGYYWSSSPFHSDANYAYDLYFHSWNIYPDSNYGCANGYSVRCFKDASVIPTSSWTTLYQGNWSAWVFWSSTDWLISVSGDGTNWYTIMDKNLWATTVFNQWDTVNDANSWYFYQRGNNYWFPHSWTVTTSSTQVDASNYWPWNYYESSTFITWSANWSNVQNGNLRWWVSQWTWETPDPTYKLHWAIQTFHRAPKAPTSITLNESAIIFSAVWDTQQLTATISPSDASKDLIWSSNDTSIATVSNTWLVTCVSLWNCVITCSAKYWSASATCDIIQVVPVTMTTTSYSQTAAYVTSSYTLFTAPSTWYYHITWTFRSNGSSWGSGCYHSLSGWTYISGTSGWKVEIYQSLVADCVYYIDAWTEFKATVQTMWYSQWWWSNFAADYYWSYDPTPDL